MPDNFPKFRKETLQCIAEAIWRFDNRKDADTADTTSQDLHGMADFRPYVALVAVAVVAVKRFIEDADQTL